ncbi:MAG: hypothetical protein K2G67_03535 [Muribaculaceae bacterium]|nr:hypothetical protein [Muribaculaceae bacterium]
MGNGRDFWGRGTVALPVGAERAGTARNFFNYSWIGAAGIGLTALCESLRDRRAGILRNRQM